MILHVLVNSCCQYDAVVFLNSFLGLSEYEYIQFLYAGFLLQTLSVFWTLKKQDFSQYFCFFDTDLNCFQHSIHVWSYIVVFTVQNFSFCFSLHFLSYSAFCILAQLYEQKTSDKWFGLKDDLHILQSLFFTGLIGHL